MRKTNDNVKNKVMIKEPYNENELYSHNWYGLYTNSGKPVKILRTGVDFYKDGKEYMVGLVEDIDKHVFCVWDMNGKSSNPDCNIYMVRYETPNYDHITKNDIPNTDEFNDAYENSQRYSFKMSPLEYLRYREFCKDHNGCSTGTSVTFTGTGIGTIVEVKCNGCGKVCDITDSENW